MDRITDRPDMTSAVYRGRKASTQTNKQKEYSSSILPYILLTNRIALENEKFVDFRM